MTPAKGYMEMKDSGIEWVGMIPAHWGICKIKYTVTQETLRAENNGGYIGLENVESWSGKIIDKHNENVVVEGASLAVCPNDILFGKLRPYLAKCAIAEKSGCCSTEFIVMRPHSIEGRFLKYVMLTPQFIDMVNMSTYGAKMPRANWDFIGNALLAMPSRDEQAAIASYLDAQCAKIDEIIAQAKASIEDYKQWKASIIYEAVTKGLDPNVEMKDSGIEWIGKIPKQWGIKQIRYLFELRDERNDLPLEQVNLISLYTDLGVVQHSDLEKITGNKAVTADGYKQVYPNDIVVNIILCWMGAIGMSNYAGVTSPAYDVYKPKDSQVTLSKYYHYLFRTARFNGKCYTVGRGIMAMRWRTYSSEFRAIKVPVPSYKTQVQIVEYLDSVCSKIDDLISEKQSLIDNLESYKKSLIYEVVTGKRRV